MSLASDLRSYLLDQPPISDLVGARVYRVIRNQGEGLPALVLTVLNDTKMLAHDGDLELRDAIVEIDAFDDDYLGADALADAVEDALHGFAGPLGERDCQYCMLNSRTDSPDDPVFADDLNTPRVVLDFEMKHLP